MKPETLDILFICVLACGIVLIVVAVRDILRRRRLRKSSEYIARELNLQFGKRRGRGFVYGEATADAPPETPAHLHLEPGEFTADEIALLSKYSADEIVRIYGRDP